MDSTKIKPNFVNVLVEVTKVSTEKDGIYIGEGEFVTKTNQAFYWGKVISKGKEASGKDQCPNLKNGDYVIFSQIAGVTIPTEDSYCKVIRGHDIVGILKDKDKMISKENIKPTKNRVLVEVIQEKIIKDGIYDDSQEDPREALTQRGIVIECAEDATQFKVGSIVHFDPYVGNPIFNDGELFLKTIHSFDILFSEK